MDTEMSVTVLTVEEARVYVRQVELRCKEALEKIPEPRYAQVAMPPFPHQLSTVS